MTLEALALRYLRFERRCMLVALERGICLGEPDAFGITPARYAIEIEIKRSMADFRANERKHHVRSREWRLSEWPKEFFFLVPSVLMEKAKSILPPYAGLLHAGEVDFSTFTAVDSPINKESKKVSIKNCCRMAAKQSLTVVSLRSKLDQLTYKSNTQYGLEYQI